MELNNETTPDKRSNGGLTIEGLLILMFLCNVNYQGIKEDFQSKGHGTPCLQK